jgi:hypothetical protein
MYRRYLISAYLENAEKTMFCNACVCANLLTATEYERKLSLQPNHSIYESGLVPVHTRVCVLGTSTSYWKESAAFKTIRFQVSRTLSVTLQQLSSFT